MVLHRGGRVHRVPAREPEQADGRVAHGVIVVAGGSGRYQGDVGAGAAENNPSASMPPLPPGAGQTVSMIKGCLRPARGAITFPKPWSRSSLRPALRIEPEGAGTGPRDRTGGRAIAHIGGNGSMSSKASPRAPIGQRDPGRPGPPMAAMPAGAFPIAKTG